MPSKQISSIVISNIKLKLQSAGLGRNRHSKWFKLGFFYKLALFILVVTAFTVAKSPSQKAVASGDGIPAIVSIATEQYNMGVREMPVGSNSGGMINVYTDNNPEKWCADFASWVYRQAGYPFTGGYSGGWRINRTANIQSWLGTYGTWHNRTTTNDVPQPGDIVAFTWSNGGRHTGIVDYVSGTTLYTIEGNKYDAITRMTYPNYKSYPYMNGWGRVAPKVNLTDIVGSARIPGTNSYWTVDGYGKVYAFGGAQLKGDLQGIALNKPVVGISSTPSGNGYWLVASDGGVFAFGDAGGYGSAGGLRLNKPVVGMAATPNGGGYWLVASDGGIFTYGNAPFKGSTGGIVLNKPVVGMASTPSGQGYWLVASDGGIFAFGDAGFYGSTGHIALNKPIVGMAPTSDGRGYWLVAADGGVFAFGNAPGYGSLPGLGMSVTNVKVIVPTSDNGGYLVVQANNQVTAFGNAIK